MARRSSSSSDPEEAEKAKSDASEECPPPPPVLSCCLGIIGRLPTASPIWSLILSLLEVEGAIIDLGPLTDGPGVGNCAFTVGEDVEIPCCLMD